MVFDLGKVRLLLGGGGRGGLEPERGGSLIKFASLRGAYMCNTPT